MFTLSRLEEEYRAIIGVSQSGVYKIKAKAISRRWGPGKVLEVEHVDDAPRARRPKVSTATVGRIIAVVTRNSTTRGWSCARIAAEVSNTLGFNNSVSAPTVYRVLQQEGYSVYKRTVKPSLNDKQKKARLDWCLKYQHQTLKDQKNVIFTDETSVQKGSVRGKRRVWRKKDEAFHNHVIVRRWKGFSEFMQQSCFTYDEKGPFWIWKKETAEEKAACKADLEARNAARYKEDKARWEAKQAEKRQTRRRKPEFHHNEENGAYVLKKGRGGINWYRYQEVILKPLLLPFARKCRLKRPGTLVQEDNAPAHASKYQQEVFDLWEIQRLLWPRNSLDLNAIEPTWFQMKRETTKRGAFTSTKAIREAQEKCWKELPQEKIQAWIERIPIHIQEVIRLEGGNEYKEGRKKGQEKRRVYN